MKKTAKATRVRRGVRVRKRRGRWHKPTKAQIKKWRAEMYRPYYNVSTIYSGHDPKLDRAIEKLARRGSDGSGMSFFTNTRDIEFRFVGRYAKVKAVAAARRIKVAKLPGVRVFIRSFEEAR